MTSRTVIAGSSFASGFGFDQGVDDPGFWGQLLHSNHPALRDTKLTNTSTAGRSNFGMFLDAVSEITKGDVGYAFIAWASVPRYEMSLGLELYETRQAFMPDIAIPAHNLNHANYSALQLSRINQRFTKLAHPHYEIVDLVKMANCLIRLGRLTNTKIIFINTNCPWDRDYFIKLSNVLPNQYTSYTQKILNIENRDDQEIFLLYDKLHLEYQQSGGIHHHHWLNLYDSMRDTKIDSMSDGRHPGPLSNQLYFERFMQDLSRVLHII